MPFSISTAGTERPPKLDIKLRVGQAFMNVVKCESLRDKWLTASYLLKMIKQRYTFRDASDFNVQVLNRAILKVNMSVDIQNGTNMTGQFRISRKFKVDGKTTQVYFYYITDEGKAHIGGNPVNSDHVGWNIFYLQAQAVEEERLTRSQAREKRPRLWDDIDTAHFSNFTL
jgi:hypothetical protein